jgi:hypothetical protein
MHRAVLSLLLLRQFHATVLVWSFKHQQCHLKPPNIAAMTRKKETILCRLSAADLLSPTTAAAAAATKTVPTAGDIIVKYDSSDNDDNDNYDDNDADDTNNFTNKRKKKIEAFSIFPRASTTLINCTSNSRKTWFLCQVLLNRRVFIEAGSKIRRVIYINCNQRDAHFNHPWENEEIKEKEEEEDEEEEEEEEQAEEDEEEEEKETKKKKEDDHSIVGREEEEDGEDDDKDCPIELVWVGLHELTGGQEDIVGLFLPVTWSSWTTCRH